MSRGFRGSLVFGILTGLVALNVLDAALTIRALDGGATEMNPLMHDLIVTHPGLFFATKMVLVGLGSAILWRHRERTSAVLGSIVVFLAYYAAVVWQMVNQLGVV